VEVGVDGIGELRFLYVGVGDVDGALALHVGALGGRLRWRFQAFGADVAAVEHGPGPLVLLADHRPPGTVLPIFAVTDLDALRRALTGAGWSVEGPLGTPEGDAVVVEDPAGAALAFLQVVRPGAMDAAWADEGNPRRVR
jgi:hypothetical protein